MTEMALSPLRRRMIEDMTVRNFVEKTQNDYIRHVKNLTAFLGRSPDTATAEELRLYQLQLTEAGVRPPIINSAVSALRFFFSVTVDRPAVTKPLTFVAEPRKIPVVLSPKEVARVLEAAPGPKYKAALSAAYGAGLRVSEVVALKVGDRARITKRVSPHTLRHSFATHLLEQNIDIRVIQVLLGHRKLDTTALYTRIAANTIRMVMSLLDRLMTM